MSYLMIAVLTSYIVGTLVGRWIGVRAGSSTMLNFLIDNNFVRTENVGEGFRIVQFDETQSVINDDHK